MEKSKKDHWNMTAEEAARNYASHYGNDPRRKEGFIAGCQWLAMKYFSDSVHSAAEKHYPKE